MKFLDEKITVAVGGWTTITTGLHPYKVKNWRGTTVFVGNVYVANGTYSATVDITDIAANSKWLPTSLPSGTMSLSNISMFDKFTVEITMGSSVYTGTSDIVAMIYRYPNRKYAIENVPLFDFTNAGAYPPVHLLQGASSPGQYPKLTPRYPWISTNKYRVLSVLESSDASATSYTFSTQGDYSGYSNTFSMSRPASVVMIGLNNIVNNSSNYWDCSFAQNYVSGDTAQIGTTNTWETVTQGRQTDFDTVGLYFVDRGRYWLWNPLLVKNRRIGEVTNLHYEEVLDDSRFNMYDSEGITIRLDDAGDEDTMEYVGLSFSGTHWNQNYAVGKKLVIDVTIDQENFGWYKTTINYVRLENVSYGSSWLDGGYHNRLAIFDTNCVADYYLQWQDRFGSFQSQPFDKVATFSEDISVSNIINYSNESRPYNFIVTPKWKIQSDWIDEDVYPFYESIFVSPTLTLYDVKEDIAYPVLVSGKYTEKTFENQHTLFNLSLDLTLNKNQNIIY